MKNSKSIILSIVLLCWNDFTMAQPLDQSLAHIEFACVYNLKINEQWNIRTRLKYFSGKYENTHLHIPTTSDVFNMSGTIEISYPCLIPKEFKSLLEDLKIRDLSFQKILKNTLSSFDHGLGADLGVCYKPQPSLQLSTVLLVSKSFFGEEFGILDQKIGFRILSTTYLTSGNSSKSTDWTASINFRPYPWFNPTISYTLSKGMFSNTVGFVIQLSVGPLTLYGLIDQFSIGRLTSKHNAQICFALAFNGSVSKNQQEKKGLDGNTPDYLDQYTNLPAVVTVDCPIDSNKERTPNDSNQYPKIPPIVSNDSLKNEWIANSVNNHFSDIQKRLCIDKNDYDNSSELEEEGEEKILPSSFDRYSNKHSEKEDNEKKVFILFNQHSQKIAKEIILDENGYPLDSDDDGIPDYLDKCPSVPGPASNNGCSEIQQGESRKIIRKAMGSIVFKPAKAVIDLTSYKSINEVVRVLKANPNYMLIINGHTDNIGNAEANLILSEKRADAVKYYLVRKGICRKRISAQGYGDAQPIDISDTPEGRSKNRRVDLVVTFFED